MTKSDIIPTIDLFADGKNIGDLKVKWSDNSVPLGYHAVPIISLRNGDGPVVVMFAGTHGDEFEGPSALMRLVHILDVAALTGQIIIVPSLNFPAMRASSRVSPLDGVNLNRAFPGDPLGGVTEQIAYYVETELLPLADAAVDLHSGGKASVFAACTLATQTEARGLFRRNLDLAKAFGLPLVWILNGMVDYRSLNCAAARAGVPMIATELGGGGGVDPEITNAAESGLYSVLRHVGVLDGDALATPAPHLVEIKSDDHNLYATGEGIFDRVVSAGQSVKAGQTAGRLHYISEPERAPETVVFPHSGVVLAHTNRGYVQRGDMLMLVVQDH
ncbi:succinylglutamate desuccinylase [Rhodophyticola sp. CCM32]|uniref:succinylglutamate desuccinylase/aspartoacylase family protein n=1 Tax=Rhodophyticola sp. CCM32 TaxID=2916397 RepID=UPI00107FA0A1|nr:succinylglutamate desuccinylase/aspartoacylase family protein [Rhodophyticola sp. CCM32]QBY00320.1 succinylglutamate desuccinylase [Rhodophyticola sp. CCM32]